MSLANTIQLLTTRVAQEFNSVRSDIANNTSIVNSALALKADITSVDTALGLKADTLYVDTALGLKANAADVYTRGETDSAIASVATAVYTKGEADLAISAGIAAVMGGATPEALNTLNELAAALGDDANFASSVATSIGLKADQATTYTKTEVDGLISPITGELSTLGALDLVALFESTLVA
jgi:hypothetical protein